MSMFGSISVLGIWLKYQQNHFINRVYVWLSILAIQLFYFITVRYIYIDCPDSRAIDPCRTNCWQQLTILCDLGMLPLSLCFFVHLTRMFEKLPVTEWLSFYYEVLKKYVYTYSYSENALLMLLYNSWGAYLILLILKVSLKF